MPIERLCTRLSTPVDAAGVVVFRILFGAVMVLSSARFVAKGWVEDLYVAPRYHFAFEGFDWLTPWPAPLMYAHFAVIGLGALGVGLGAFYRTSACVFFLAFTCVELFDKSYYLNHYYLVSLIALLLCVLPLHGCASIDAWRRPELRNATVATWIPWLLRAQIAMVYLHAGLAKLDADWLLRAEPLATWLASHRDAPVVGRWLAEPAVAHAMSWAGALYDLAIVPLLLWPRTRWLAFGGVVTFHTLTWLLFPIGVFPWLMIATSTIFLPHDWASRWLARLEARRDRIPTSAARPLRAPRAALLGGYLLLQLALPLRHLAYPGDVNWTEQGFRFAWRVMLIEKTGYVELRVHDPDTGRRWVVSPEAELTRMQYAMMSTQPDMIAQYARHIAERFRAEGVRNVRVYADAWASLNGRPARRLVSPKADLARSRGGLARLDFVLPSSDG